MGLDTLSVAGQLLMEKDKLQSLNGRFDELRTLLRARYGYVEGK